MSEKEKKPKKRGRKPKNIIQPSQNIKVDTKINDNIIIHIKQNKTEKVDNEVIDGYLKDKDNYKSFHHDALNCWNCTYLIEDRIKNIPLKYNNNTFYIYGNFCSDTCCIRYITDTFKNNELWEKYGLFKFYNRIIYDKDININIPPNRLTLKKFGGDLEIEDYRNINDNHLEINTPLIIPVKNIIQNNDNYVVKNKTDLKLYRKPAKVKTIFDEMNIKK